jgi:hypothetical protein
MERELSSETVDVCFHLGHCVHQYPNNITLRVGSTFKDYGGKIIEIADVIVHPRFDSIKYTNDFALLIFKEPLEFDENIQPIQLPFDFEKILPGTKCLVSGWGKMENDERPQELRSVEVSVVDAVGFVQIRENSFMIFLFDFKITCARNYNTDRVKFRITSSMLCAGVPEGQKDACSGDSVGLFLGFRSKGNHFLLFLQGWPLRVQRKTLRRCIRRIRLRPQRLPWNLRCRFPSSTVDSKRLRCVNRFKVVANWKIH